MKWILIAWIFTGTIAGKSTSAAIDVEFNTQEACQAAAAQLLEERGWEGAMCFPKGEASETE